MAKRTMPIETTINDRNKVIVEKEKPKKAEPVFGIVKDCVSLNIRKSEDISSEIVGELKVDTEVKILDTVGGWHKIKNGYVMADYIRLK